MGILVNKMEVGIGHLDLWHTLHYVSTAQCPLPFQCNRLPTLVSVAFFLHLDVPNWWYDGWPHKLLYVKMQKELSYHPHRAGFELLKIFGKGTNSSSMFQCYSWKRHNSLSLFCSCATLSTMFQGKQDKASAFALEESRRYLMWNQIPAPTEPNDIA